MFFQTELFAMLDKLEICEIRQRQINEKRKSINFYCGYAYMPIKFSR